MQWFLLLLDADYEQQENTMNRPSTRSANKQALVTRKLAWALIAAVVVFTMACAGDGGAGDDTLPATAAIASTQAPATSQAPATASTTTSDSRAPAAVTGESPTTENIAPEYRHQRIVSLSPTGTEILYAIGAGDRVVAVDEYSYYPPGTPVTDLSGWNPNIEAIVSFDPDLVVVDSGGDVVTALETLGIEVLIHEAPTTLDDVYDQITQFGMELGHGTEAALLATEMSARVEELIAEAPDATGLTYYHELDDTLYSVTSGTFIGHVYSLFGLGNVADPADSDGSAFGYPQLSDEYLLDADPDIIFLADTLCCGQNANTVAARAGWDQLTAVQTGRVVGLNDDVVSRWGPRLIEFIETVSETLVAIGAAE